MSDPVSMRHVMAQSDYSERIQKTEQVQQQGVREEFNKELQRQEDLKRTQVTEGEESEEAKIRDEERERRRKEEQEAAEAEESGEETPEEAKTSGRGDHLIDVEV